MLLADSEILLHSDPLPRGTDLDTVRRSGTYVVHNPVDGPSAGSFVVYVVNFLNKGIRYTFQQCVRIEDETIWYRFTEQPWVLVNGGAMSGDTIVEAINQELGSDDWQSGGGPGSATNISITVGEDSVAIASSSGTGDEIPAATDETAGVLSAEDKAKLDGIAANAEPNLSVEEIIEEIDTALGGEGWQSGSTDITVTREETQVVIASSTGEDGILHLATQNYAGAMSPTDKTKLDSVSSGAEANLSGSALLAAIDTAVGGEGWRENTDLSAAYTESNVSIDSSTGEGVSIAEASNISAGVMSATDKTKLMGIESGATADMTPAEIVAAIDSALGSDDWHSGESVPDNVLYSDEPGQVLTTGFSVTPRDGGTVSAGTFFVNPGLRALQEIVVGGDISISPSTVTGQCAVLLTQSNPGGNVNLSAWDYVVGPEIDSAPGGVYRLGVEIYSNASVLYVLKVQ